MRDRNDAEGRKWANLVGGDDTSPAGVVATGDPVDARSPVLFLLRSENHGAGAFAAACEDALVLQTLGAACDPADASTRATIEYAVVARGVRHVVVCGHQGSAVASEGLESPHATQAAVVSECLRLRDDDYIGSLLRAYRVALRPLWFDAEGDAFVGELEDARFVPIGDDDSKQMLALFARRTTTRNHDAP